MPAESTTRIALLLLLAVVIVAGCGSSTVVVKTRVVHPCATPAAMTRCVDELVRESVKEAGDVATVKVDCKTSATGFSCLRLIDYGADVTDCARWSIRRIGPGLPFIAGGEISFDCTRWTS